MVAKITMPRSPERVLGYNEQKVKRGKAVCIGGENFLGEAGALSWMQKLNIFRFRNELNDRANTRMIHISLNFDPSESVSPKQLNSIASVYMQKIGFGEQPYFVYQHHDAGHPHIHIVSTTIRPDGSRISTHNLGRNQSEKARKEIEDSFRLIKAETKKKRLTPFPKKAETGKLIYGEGETKQRISGIVQTVTQNFCYASLSELNAVLGIYNVIADPGTANSALRARRGLYYRLLDENGSKAGVATKASELPGKPTLHKLETNFEENRNRRGPLKSSLQQTLDSALLQKPSDLNAFKKELLRHGIHLLLRTNSDGNHYGITFIDTLNCCVFNGSDLGKAYGLTSLQNSIPMFEIRTIQTIPEKQNSSQLSKRPGTKQPPSLPTPDLLPTQGLIHHLITPVPVSETIPAPLLQKKGKRKKKGKHS